MVTQAQKGCAWLKWCCHTELSHVQGVVSGAVKGCKAPPATRTRLSCGAYCCVLLMTTLCVSCSPWYRGPTLFQTLDETEVPARDPLAPFRMAVIDKFKDLGTVVMGKSESGAVRKGDTLLLMPNK